MKDKHLNQEGVPRVLVTYWKGQMPWYVVQCLNNNVEYFDRVILFTDRQQSELLRVNVEQVNEIYILNLLGLQEFSEKLLKIGPNIISDLFCLFPKYLTNQILGTTYDKVMKLDTNSFVYNRALVNELFGRFPKDQGLYLKESMGNYLQNNYKNYISGDFSFDYTDFKQFDSLRTLVYNWIKEDTTNRYTFLGPVFMNSKKFSEYLFRNNGGQLSIPYCEMDLSLCHKGANYIDLVSKGLALEFSNTLLESIGFDIEYIQRDDNKIKVILNEL